MKRFTVSSENGPTVRAWAYSARNARFAYTLMYANCGLTSCGEVTIMESTPSKTQCPNGEQQ